ncbi:MAG: glycosyltransferase family 4 protein [Gammaproteobacteria bacterium]|nr:MAG: glycosyltransferase family 4 protein [Gammaproteobacteria bacterium]
MLKSYAIRKGIIDIPNARSSHEIPTPRGGGLSFVIVFLVSLGGFLAFRKIEVSTFFALFIGGGLIATIGFIDDRINLNPKIRIATHFLAGSIGIYLLGGIPPLLFFGIEINFGILGNILAVFGVVWILNLNNFMDGIDGIASVEAISLLLIISLLIIFQFPNTAKEQEVIIASLILASAVLGFLFWNFPPAKIFMGDAGSGFLGIMIALLGVKASHIHGNFFWIILVMFGVFMVDATTTLIRRLLQGEKVYEAHRSHAYQHASRLFGHKTVTLSVLAINILLLAPMSWLVVSGKIDGFFAFLISYSLLFLLATVFKAGKPD